MNISRFRKKCRRNEVEIQQLAHDLLNQLSVINLCSFKLHVVMRELLGPAVTDNLQALDQSVEDAMRLAERLSQAIVASSSHTSTKARLVKSPIKAENILRLFAREQPAAITETRQSSPLKTNLR
jgi:hypothetical protein